MSAREEFLQWLEKADRTSPNIMFDAYKAGLEAAASKMRGAGFHDFADELLKEGE